MEGNGTGRDEVRPDFGSRRQRSPQDSPCLFFRGREHLHKLLSAAATIVLLAAVVLNVCDVGCKFWPEVLSKLMTLVVVNLLINMIRVFCSGIIAQFIELNHFAVILFRPPLPTAPYMFISDKYGRLYNNMNLKLNCKKWGVVTLSPLSS